MCLSQSYVFFLSHLFLSISSFVLALKIPLIKVLIIKCYFSFFCLNFTYIFLLFFNDYSSHSIIFS